MQHSFAEKFVLLSMTPRCVRRTVDNLTLDDDFLRQKLVSRQINFRTVLKPIPVVVTHLGAVDVNLSENQVTTEQILHHKRRHPTLVTCRVV